MTQYTPEQARHIAGCMERGAEMRNMGAPALRSLADQVEALTTENASILRASLYSADLATQAMEDVKTLTTERDALLQANLTHITEFGELQGWALSHPKSNLADSGVIAALVVFDRLHLKAPDARHLDPQPQLVGISQAVLGKVCDHAHTPEHSQTAAMCQI